MRSIKQTHIMGQIYLLLLSIFLVFLVSPLKALAVSQATITDFTVSNSDVGATGVTYTLEFTLNEAISVGDSVSMNFDLNRMSTKNTWEGGDQTSNMATATGTFGSFQYDNTGSGDWIPIDFGFNDNANYFHREISTDNSLLIWGLGYVDDSHIHSIQDPIPADKTVRLIVTDVTNPAKAGAYAFSVESGLGPTNNTSWELPSDDRDRALYVDIGDYCLRAIVNTPTGATAIAKAEMYLHNSDWSVSSWGGRTFANGAISYYADDFWYNGGPSQQTCPIGAITLEANPPFGVTTYAKAADKIATLPGDANTFYATPIIMSAIQLQGRLNNPAVGSGQYDYVTNSNVSFRPSDFSPTGFKNTQSDADGIFKMGGLTVGTYIIEFMMPWQSGYEGISAPDQIQIEIDSTSKVKTVSGSNACPVFTTSCDLGDIDYIIATKTISGTLKDSDGTPITSGRIQAFKEMGMGQAQSEVDASGNYSLTVGGGTWGLRPEPNWDPSNPPDWSYCGMPKFFVFQSGTGVETKTSASTGGQTNFTIKRTNLTITGDVVYPNGSPLTGQGGVEVRSKEGCGTFAQLDGTGHFSTKVAPGTYNVMVQIWDQTYSAPSTQTITVSTSNYDIGTLTLTEKKDTITGRVWNDVDGDGVYDSGEGISGQQINASKMSKKFDEFGGPGSGPMMGPGGGDFTGTTSGNNGAYSLKVTPGTWMINLMSDPGMMGGYSNTQTNYIYTGSPLQVNVTSSASGATFPDNNFKITAADATIKGKVVDAAGNGISGIWGFAFADAGGGGPMMGAGMGAPIQNGIFTIKVPAGTYNVGVQFPPESSGYTPASSTETTIIAGETKSINITVKPNNSRIKVNFKDTNGNAITTLSQANIFADNGAGGHMFKMLYGSDLISGSTTLSVSEGTWSIGYFIDPTENNYMSEPMSKDNGITVTSVHDANNPAVLNITLRSSDSTISGTVTDPTGTALAGVWISTDNRKASGFSAGGPMFMMGDATDSNGSYSISIPAGTYKVQAFLPPSMGYINPDGVEVTVSATSPGTANLQFTQSDAAITGSVYLSAVKKGAFISAYSDKGGYSETNANSGDFTLNVTKNDTWYLRAMYESGSDFYQSTINEVIMGGATAKSQNLTLTKASFTLPDAVSSTFDYTNAKKISLGNGFSISIPAGAIPPTSSATGNNITISISPTAQLSTQNKSIPIGIGYEITATDDSGSLITSNFNDNVTITIPYTATYLEEALGSSDETLLDNGYWDTTTSTWKGITGTTIDTTAKTISFTVNHFTTFSILSNKDPNTVGGGSPSSGTNTAGSNSNNSPNCGDQVPSNAPQLFEIRRSGDQAKLYFAPARNPVSYYYIAYGSKENPQEHGVSFDQGYSSGALTFTINKLRLDIDYYFQIRAGNGCMPGPWSNIVLVKPNRTTYLDGTSKLTSGSLIPKSSNTKVIQPSSQTSTPTSLIDDVETSVSPPSPTSVPTVNTVDETETPPQKLSIWDKIKSFLHWN